MVLALGNTLWIDPMVSAQFSSKEICFLGVTPRNDVKDPSLWLGMEVHLGFCVGDDVFNVTWVLSLVWVLVLCGGIFSTRTVPAGIVCTTHLYYNHRSPVDESSLTACGTFQGLRWCFFLPLEL